MLHERTDEVLQVFEEGKHMACFADANELLEHIRFYLEHEDERRRISQAGLHEAASLHTWDQRIEVVLDRHAALIAGGA